MLPLGLTGAVVIRNRPSLLAWLGIVLLLWFEPTSVKLITGNPVMWAMAAVAAGTVWAWPGVFALLKPSLAPFALVGATHRSWWLAAGMSGLVALAFAPMWPDYVSVLRNAVTPGGPMYSIQEIPMLCIPLIAWLGRSAERDREPRSTDASYADSVPGTSPEP
jgi:hypothetical protein